MAVKLMEPVFFKTFKKSTLEQCAEMYKSCVQHISYSHRYLLRSIIGLKAIYGNAAKNTTKKPNNISNAHSDRDILALYDSLPLEHCLELYRRQHNNLNDKTKFALKAMIGAKVVYGENYGKPLQSTDSSSES